jgi:hypothetical protein
LTELEELRAEVRRLEEWLHVALDDRDHYHAEAKRLHSELEAERADVIAFIRHATKFRTKDGQVPVVRLPDYLDALRGLIEAGKHRREEEK